MCYVDDQCHFEMATKLCNGLHTENVMLLMTAGLSM